MSPVRRSLVLVLTAVTIVVVPAHAQSPVKPRPRVQASRLFGGFDFVRESGNRVACGFFNTGLGCTGSGFDPGLGEDGIWPRGTSDTYIFDAGLQIAGMIPSSAGFAWAGDTVGAFFLDFRGDQIDSRALTPIYNSRDTADDRQWPLAAYVRDTALFAPRLLGRVAVSDQDLWFRYWEAVNINGRTHPMGIVVDQRVFAWNAPDGNRDILYLLFTLTNISASDPTAYAGIDPAIRSDFTALGAQYHALIYSAYGVQLPSGGYPLESLFVSLSMDPDVGNAGTNYSTVSLPFSTAFAYESSFLTPTGWTLPADIFAAPGMWAAPGLVGVSWLKFPHDTGGKPAGVRIWSNNTGSATGFPDAVGVRQLYRYLSGTTSPSAGDQVCFNQGQQLVYKYCFQTQTPFDTRFFFSSGPFRLNPGEQQDVVIAYEFAAPRDTVRAYVGGDLKPGQPVTGDSIAADPTKVRLSERVAGWQSQADTNGNGQIDEYEVTTYPGSLLRKAQQALAIADAKFLLPSAPDAPAFYLIPGDKQVTVVWQKSATETTGDPYFALASDPSSALYDPNFRQFDVEGYRIYRGASPNALQLVAQFDYSGTVIADYVGNFAYAGQCAPELGVMTDCPVAFAPTPNPAIHADHPLAGDVIQVPVGGRLLAPNGLVAIVRADTAVTGGNSGYPALSDQDASFAFVDVGLLNSFPYYYAVTAFDVNSIRSSASSLESPRVVKSVSPRKPATTNANALVVEGVYGDDGVALNPAATYSAMDSATGTFSGPVPPANGATFDLLFLATEVLPAGKIVARVDSVSAGLAGGIGTPPTLFLTLSTSRDTVRDAIPLPEPSFNISPFDTRPYGVTLPLVRDDSVAARRYSPLPDTGRRGPVRFAGTATGVSQTSSGGATIIGRYGAGNTATRYLAHSRWFDEGQPEPPDPTIVGDPSPRHNSGGLTGVGLIWAPQAYRSSAAAPINNLFRGYAYAQTVWYPADFVVTWNADSSVTVRDVTHHVNLPLALNGGSGFGFVNTRVFSAAGIAPASLADGTGTVDTAILGYHHLYAIPATCTWYTISCITLERKAQFEPLDFNSDAVADANGIAIYVNGEVFMMEMPQLPAVGTKWHLREVSGNMSATCTPSLGAVMTDCTAYTFNGWSVRPAYAPGLQYVIDVQRPFTVDTLDAGDLARVHTVPDPFYVTDGFAVGPDSQRIQFVNLPTRAIIRIYSVSGRLVAYFTHNDPTGGGEEGWNVLSRDGKRVASGVYFYVIEAPDRRTKVGRFTVVTVRR
jgi:hypothetical protein